MICVQDTVLFLWIEKQTKRYGLPCTRKGSIRGRQKEKQGGKFFFSYLWETVLFWKIVFGFTVETSSAFLLSGTWELSLSHFVFGRNGLFWEPAGGPGRAVDAVAGVSVFTLWKGSNSCRVKPRLSRGCPCWTRMLLCTERCCSWVSLLFI